MDKTIKKLLEKIEELIKEVPDKDHAYLIRSLAGAILDLAHAWRTNRESR